MSNRIYTLVAGVIVEMTSQPILCINVGLKTEEDIPYQEDMKHLSATEARRLARYLIEAAARIEKAEAAR